MNEKLIKTLASSLINGMEMMEMHLDMLPVTPAYREVIREASDLVQAIVRAAFLSGEPSPEVAGKIHALHTQFVGDGK